MSTRLDDRIKGLFDAIDNGDYSGSERLIMDIEDITDFKDQLLDFELAKFRYYLETKQADVAKAGLERELIRIELSKINQIKILLLDIRIKVNMGEFFSADGSMYKIHNLFGKLKDFDKKEFESLAGDLNNLSGLINASNGNYHDAMGEFEKASLEFARTNSLKQCATALFIFGQILYMVQNIDKTIAMLEESAKLFKDSNQIAALASTYELLSKCAEYTGDQDNIYTYDQLRKDLKEKLEFEKLQLRVNKERQKYNIDLYGGRRKINELEAKLVEAKLAEEYALNQTNLLDAVNKQKIGKYDKLEEQLEALKEETAIKDLTIENLKAENLAQKHELSQIFETKQFLAQEIVKTEMLTADVEEL